MRPTRMRFVTMTMWTAATLMLVSFGCQVPTKTKPAPSESGDPNYPTPTSPAMVLANLQKAYVSKNYDQYIALLDSSFVFVLSPKDVAQDPTMPEQWKLPTERLIHQRMFQDTTVENITLSFNSLPPAELDTLQYSGRNYWKVRVDGIHLDVWVRRDQLWDYKVPSGTGDFYMSPDSSRMVGGAPVWRIMVWADEPIGSTLRPAGDKVKQLTWGKFKFYYAS